MPLGTGLRVFAEVGLGGRPARCCITTSTGPPRPALLDAREEMVAGDEGADPPRARRCELAFCCRLALPLLRLLLVVAAAVVVVVVVVDDLRTGVLTSLEGVDATEPEVEAEVLGRRTLVLVGSFGGCQLGSLPLNRAGDEFSLVFFFWFCCCWNCGKGEIY